MRVLVVGGTRFVGYFLVWRLLARGDRVTLFHRATTPDPFGERVERLRGDRTTGDFERLLGGRDFDACVDMTAYEGSDVRRASDLFADRVGHYVFVSTGQVYLVRDGCPVPSKESDYAGPLRAAPADPDEQAEWAYGMGKRACEDCLDAAFEERRFPATRLRIPMVNGERDYLRRIERYLWRILDGQPLVLPDAGREIARHVYGQDVARAIAGILGYLPSFGEAYNLAQEELPTVAELVRRLVTLCGGRSRIVSVPREAVTAADLDPLALSPFSTRWMSCLDPEKAREDLGFRHASLDDYLGRIVASFLARPPSVPPPGYERRAAEVALAQRWQDVEAAS